MAPVTAEATTATAANQQPDAPRSSSAASDVSLATFGFADRRGNAAVRRARQDT
jgi:hypothetical protein